MEEQEHIRKKRFIYYILVLFFILTQSSSSALSTNSDQANWEMCTFESSEFDPSLCMQGAVKNTNTPSCLSRCCACPSGTFMDKFNNCSMCKPLRDCEAEGKRVLVKGSTTQDTVCGDDILATTDSWSTVPVMMTTPQAAVESTSATIQPNQTKPHLAINTTCNPPGADEGGGGISVIKFDGGSAVLIILCTLPVFFVFVILLFIGYPKIPQRLHELLFKKKPQRNFNAVPMKDLEAGSEPADV